MFFSNLIYDSFLDLFIYFLLSGRNSSGKKSIPFLVVRPPFMVDDLLYLSLLGSALGEHRQLLNNFNGLFI